MMRPSVVQLIAQAEWSHYNKFSATPSVASPSDCLQSGPDLQWRRPNTPAVRRKPVCCHIGPSGADCARLASHYSSRSASRCSRLPIDDDATALRSDFR